MKRVFKGRVYFGNTYYFYLFFIFFLVLGSLLFFDIINPSLKLGMGLTPRSLGMYISSVSLLCLIWMTLWTLNLFQWYTVDGEGIAVVRFGSVFKKFYFKDLSSVTQLSTEETRELLYAEYAPSLLFRRAPMENIATVIEKVPKSVELSGNLIELTRYATAPIVVGGYKTGYQYPTLEDAKKTFHFFMRGSFVLLKTKENKHVIISPKDIDDFITFTDKFHFL